MSYHNVEREGLVADTESGVALSGVVARSWAWASWAEERSVSMYVGIRQYTSIVDKL